MHTRKTEQWGRGGNFHYIGICRRAAIVGNQRSIMLLCATLILYMYIYVH